MERVSSRRLLQRGASPTSTRSTCASPACPRSRCGSASSASSATSSTSRARTASTSGTRCSSRAPISARGRSGSSRSGSSASRRATSSSARTRTPSRTCSRRRCRGSSRRDKDDFVGKWATEQVAERGLKWMLAGFESPSGKLPLEGGQVVVGGKLSGRVTSARRSAELGKVIGLAILPQRARGRRGAVRRRHRRQARADARPPRPVLRSRGREAQGMSALEFLSVSAASDGVVAKSSMERAQRERGARFEERDGWLVPVASSASEEHIQAAGRDRRPLAPGGSSRCARPATPPEDDGASTTGSRRSASLVLCEPSELAGGQLPGHARARRDRRARHPRDRRARRPARVIRRLTHLHRVPEGGEVAHITAHVLNPRPTRTGSSSRRSTATTSGRSRSTGRQPLGGGPIGVDAL